MNETIYMVRGRVEESQRIEKKENFTVCNFMTSGEPEGVINSSKLVISRSGYTTLMDLATLEKPCFLIQPPGQPEQEYLACLLKKNGDFLKLSSV